MHPWSKLGVAADGNSTGRKDWNADSVTERYNDDTKLEKTKKVLQSQSPKGREEQAGKHKLQTATKTKG